MSVNNISVLGFKPKADPKFCIEGENYRITVLTDRLLRLEDSESGAFEDHATRFAANRSFDKPCFEQFFKDGYLHIKTTHLHLIYDQKPFTPNGLRIIVDGSKDWNFGTKGDNMGGTIRTLDNILGSADLDDGLLSRYSGYTFVDDSNTLAIGEDGWPVPSSFHTDVYFFGYNTAYEDCIKDFYKLSGASPILPRYALGNWWSKYHAYTDEEYRQLINDFKSRNIPLSVGVIDMDWHITETPDRVLYGDGWTGYSWNKELFPKPEETLKFIHDSGLKVSLNLHPKDGIRGFEDCYGALCKELGVDESTKEQIEFDAGDNRFMDAYFKTVLNPMERDGVDFWWIDWQQIGHTNTSGYDILWMLNHCHYIDSAKDSNIPLTLSRYAGIGSHRYPLGFSGDAGITWEALDFQPAFTATAANVGYSYWSHDIGGHFRGYTDDELYTRWVEFGVFSPVMRLHCARGPFYSKEPWLRDKNIEEIVTDYMRLRHKMLPYTFTEMYRNHEEGIPFIRPLYHKYPDCEPAYFHKNAYLFGSELLVYPITKKADSESKLACSTGYVPSGKFVDIFNGRIYSGGRNVDFYRRLEGMPVLAYYGSIVPYSLDIDKNGADNPERIELNIFGSADGSYTMVEDNGKSGAERETLRTEYSFTFGKQSVLSFESPKAIETVPGTRQYTVRLVAFTKPDSVTLNINGKETDLEFTFDERTNTVLTCGFAVNEEDSVKVIINGDGKEPQNNIKDPVFEILWKYGGEIHEKEALWSIVCSSVPTAQKIQEILTFDGNLYTTTNPYSGNKYVARALIEILSADE